MSADRRADGALLRRACETLADGVIVTDPDAAVLFCNPAAYALLGESPGDAGARAAVDARVDESAPGRPASRELNVPGPNRRLSVRSQALLEGTETVGYLTVLRDISEQHRFAAMRRDFAANVSHELRTPVGGLVTLSERWRESVTPPRPSG